MSEHEPEVLEDIEDGTDAPSNTLVTVEEQAPDKLLVADLIDSVLFPGMMLPLLLSDERQRELAEQAWNQSRYVGLVARRREVDEDEIVKPSDLHEMGVAAKLLRFDKRADGSVHLIVQTLNRMRIKKYLRKRPYLFAAVEYPEDEYGDSMRTEALLTRTKETLGEVLSLIPGIPEEFNLAALGIAEAGRLSDFVASNFEMKLAQRQNVLDTLNVTERLEQVLVFLTGELEVRRLGHRIQQEIQEKIEQSQKEYFLREQMRLIRRELGEEIDERDAIREEYEQKIEAVGMSEEAHERAVRELERLIVLTPDASEYHVIKTYLDWLTDLPWSNKTEDDNDIKRAERILAEDHYGLDDVKERIIEYLAVRKLKPDHRGAILCLAGPPGVGKTSLGRSIARSLGREFFRFSLGGMRDEAEIKGHRRTYVGALPGKILQGLKRVGTRNPVFMLDEIDKLGSDWRGDPSSAMLEVLDPEQNSEFLDHYLDVQFDLSDVMFICTANVKGNIPRPLLDRMEVIDISSYIDDEKYHIASRYLLPRQRERHGLKAGQVRVSRGAYFDIINGYTREAGVRNLDRQMARICRKTATGIARGDRERESVTKSNLARFLGPRRFFSDELKGLKRAGTAAGLAWTPVGGDTLLIEVRGVRGKGRVELTGQLGKVMTESVRIALSYVKGERAWLDVPEDLEFDNIDLHFHFPAGAIPKDGPSAGITITTALISLLGDDGDGRRVRPNLAMTGEITLGGRVLAVGGVREKVIAAKRAGMKHIILPARNEKDLEEIPSHILAGLEIHPVETYRQVYELAFPKK